MSCIYFNQSGKPLSVTVAYALPTDFNPWSDFDFGCTTTNHAPGYLPVTGFPWDTQHRVFFILESKSWSYAEFQDPYNVVGSHDVSAFENITRTMLGSAQPAAHNCELPGGGDPVPLTFPWTFGFSLSSTANGVSISGGGNGSFMTTPSTTGLATGVISDLHASDIVLTATAKGSPQQSITIRVGSPISFRSYYRSTLKTSIKVVDSSYPSCPKGATGTMTVTTEPAVVLSICGNLVPAVGELATASIRNVS